MIMVKRNFPWLPERHLKVETKEMKDIFQLSGQVFELQWAFRQFVKLLFENSLNIISEEASPKH